MKRLIIRDGDRVIRHELGDEPVTIGRDPECTLSFSDQRLSRKHCRVEAIPEGVRYRDLGSRNGSFLNSKRVEVVNLMLRDAGVRSQPVGRHVPRRNDDVCFRPGVDSNAERVIGPMA